MQRRNEPSHRRSKEATKRNVPGRIRASVFTGLWTPQRDDLTTNRQGPEAEAVSEAYDHSEAIFHLVESFILPWGMQGRCGVLQNEGRVAWGDQSWKVI